MLFIGAWIGTAGNRDRTIQGKFAAEVIENRK